MYVVKVNRAGATSVLTPPMPLEEAETVLRTHYTEPYQSDQYYLEEWKVD